MVSSKVDVVEMNHYLWYVWNLLELLTLEGSGTPLDCGLLLSPAAIEVVRIRLPMSLGFLPKGFDISNAIDYYTKRENVKLKLSIAFKE